MQLSVTLGLNQTYHHEVIGQIASYSDLKVCLNAMIAFLNTGHFTRLLSTYHEGKITFFKTEEEMAAYISECQEHFNPHFKTFQFVYSFHKGTLPELINKEDIMLKLEYLTRRFEALYLPLSDESKRAVIKELKAEAIKTQLAKQNHTDRFVAVEAVLLALTYISEPSTDDFIQLVKLSIMSLKISLEPLDKNSMGYSLCGHLLNKINRLSQNMPEDAQEAIRALKEYIELGRMVSEHQPIPQISFFRPSAQPSMAVQEQQRDQHASVIH